MEVLLKQIVDSRFAVFEYVEELVNINAEANEKAPGAVSEFEAVKQKIEYEKARIDWCEARIRMLEFRKRSN